MIHKDRKISRRFDVVYRNHATTKEVYSSENADPIKMQSSMEDKYPPFSEYNIYFGELHGHTNLSDASPDIDSYFITARDEAKLDFCAVTDHDHGGIKNAELWGEKWELTKQKVRQYHENGEFVTILAYEKDAYPWYNNLVLYYNNDEGEIVRSETDGEINRAELEELLAREDIITVPHTTAFLHSGCDFAKMPPELMTSLIEVYSRWGTAEYFGNPNPERIETLGGFWQDALERGAKMGCISGSDDHTGTPGLINSGPTTHSNLRYGNPGMVAVLAKELTRESIFEALKERRCYATSGARITLDFRINGNVMGSEITLEKEKEREIFIGVKNEDSNIKTITLVCNSEDVIVIRENGETNDYKELIYDYQPQRDCDYYYIRVELMDGRMAWSSPIWVAQVK